MKIVSVPMERICADVAKAATDKLKEHGIAKPAVVVNFVWTEAGTTYGCGTAIPKTSKGRRQMLGDSLAQSAEEASDV